MQPPDVDAKEQKRIETKGFRDFLEPPDETGIRWIRRKKGGICFFLGKDNKCMIYDSRPSICRLEPFTITDYDYENNRLELDFNFPFSACCEGVCNTQTVDYKEIAESALTLLQKILALTAQDLELPVNDKRVHSETRSRLLRRGVEAADLQV